MRLMLVGFLALGAAACVMPSGEPRRHPFPTGQESNSGIRLPGHVDKIPDTPYEVRKGEIDRDRQIAGQSGPAYPPLFKNQKNGDPGGQ